MKSFKVYWTLVGLTAFLNACGQDIKFKEIPEEIKPPALETPNPSTTTTSTTTTTTNTTTSTTTTSTTTTSTTTTSTTTTSTTTTSTTTSTTTTTTSTTTSTTTTTTTTTLPPPVETRYEQRDTYAYDWTKSEFLQDTYDFNRLSAHFRAFDSRSRTVRGLKKEDLLLKENGIEIQNYTLSSSSINTGQVVDIVFTLDITGSMKAEINSIKENVRNFVSDLQNQLVHANLCLVTFKDDVENTCSKFVLDNPSTPENENIDYFLDQLNKVDVGGGGDPRENSLGGTLNAVKNTDWNVGSQRMVILFTDAYFWVQPIHRHEREAQFAPTYPEVLEAIEDKGANVFVVAPKAGGYSKNYFKYPGMPQVSGGTWFNIKHLRKGQITIDGIFDYIRETIRTTYEIKYTAEENSLDPTLPIAMRQLTIESTETEKFVSIQLDDHQSNMPNGRPDLKDRFLLSGTSPVNEDTLLVYLNGVETLDYRVENGYLIFPIPPTQGSRILAQYELGNLIDNVVTRPFVLKGDGILRDFSLVLNGINADMRDYEVTMSLNGTYHLILKPQVYSNEDPYKIRESLGLEIFSKYIKITQP